MIVSIDGAGKKRTEELYEAVQFFADILMDPRVVRNLEIDIEVESGLDVQGEVISEDDCKNPRYFTIRLKRNQQEDIIKTLAHEMVHVKQYAKNELGKEFALARGGKGLKIATRWHGEFWNPKRKEDAYFDAPWEIEAYGKEVGLYHRWIARKSK